MNIPAHYYYCPNGCIATTEKGNCAICGRTLDYKLDRYFLGGTRNIVGPKHDIHKDRLKLKDYG